MPGRDLENRLRPWAWRILEFAGNYGKTLGPHSCLCWRMSPHEKHTVYTHSLPAMNTCTHMYTDRHTETCSSSFIHSTSASGAAIVPGTMGLPGRWRNRTELLPQNSGIMGGKIIAGRNAVPQWENVGRYPKSWPAAPNPRTTPCTQ
jgi:hypothetical protein